MRTAPACLVIVLRISPHACAAQRHVPPSKHTPMPSTCCSSPTQSAPAGTVAVTVLCHSLDAANMRAASHMQACTTLLPCVPAARQLARTRFPSFIFLAPTIHPFYLLLQHTHNHPARRSTAERPADWGRARALPRSSLRELCNEIPSHLYTPPRALIFLTLTSHIYMSSPLWWCLEPGFGSHHKGVSLAMARRTRT